MLIDPDLVADGNLSALEHRLSSLLWQLAGSEGSVSMRNAMNVLPWKWGNWMQTKKSKSVRLLTTGSLFDPSHEGTPPRERFRVLVNAVIRHTPGMQKNVALDQLVRFVLDEVQDVRIASAPTSSPTAIQGTWRKLHNRPSIYQEPLPTESSSRWNRLEQRLQNGTVTDTEEFRLVVPPLNANRTYLIRVETESSPSDDSEQETPLSTYFWADTKSSDYVSLDVGLLYAREIKKLRYT
ncbi:MAG: hypothetical protein O3B73_08175 [bacterium]|nr:hypothetical protein [bacterium]